MILLYHKVDLSAPTKWWVTPRNFHRQMQGLQGRKVVYLDDYDPADPDQVVITFDGVYAGVRLYALPVLQKFDYPFELFVIGDYVGGDNRFDESEPHARFASLRQLRELVEGGGRLQWHTKTHADMVASEQVRLELEVPEVLRELDPSGFKWLAYPHDRRCSAIDDIVSGRFRICPPRKTVENATSLSASTVSLIIPNYNYGQFIEEAIDSALRQTVPPDEILVIDDCSTDGSVERIQRYARSVHIVQNAQNLGIVKNFNKAVSLTSGSYICFLGADNRFRSDYVEKCKTLLDTHPEVDIAYTDLVLFGPRAEAEAIRLGVKPDNGLFIWRFPEFDPSILQRANFIHGSSMYRRSAYDRVGGYRESQGPEDYNLFRRIVESGGAAKRVPEPLLEYRQHSGEQTNTVRSYAMEIANLRNEVIKKETRIAYLERQLAQCTQTGYPRTQTGDGLTLRSF